jgi:pimeloyl-ACP methyl ester carboxylesterase
MISFTMPWIWFIFAGVAGYVGAAYLATRYALDRRPTPPREITLSPAAWGLTPEPITFVTGDGLTLAGWWFSALQARGTVVMAHGRGGHKNELLPQVGLFIEHGYNILLFDQRAHGKSEGRFTTAGRLEAEDLLRAAALARQKQAAPILLYGFSMGARAALLAAAHRPEIAGVIAVAPGLSLAEWLRRQFKRKLGLPPPPGFYAVFAAIARLRTGHAYDHAALDLTRQAITLPVLLIGGERDWICLPADLRRLQAVIPQAELVVIPGAEHTGIFTDRYRQEVAAFLARVAEP